MPENKIDFIASKICTLKEFKIGRVNLRQNPTNRSDYNYFSKMNTRWNDNDIYGHLNNVIYYELFDTAVNKWLIKNNLIDIKKE